MPTGDPGINKPFDRILKYFMDREPRLFLRLLGFTVPVSDVELQPLRPETAPPVAMPDFVALARIMPDLQFVMHAEFQANYHNGIPRAMARYGGSLGWQYLLPVESVLVLFRPEGLPAEIPNVGDYNIGETHTTHPYRVVRLWELDPTPVLETNDPKLLPWAVMLKTSDEQVRQIAALVAESRDEETRAYFLILGGVRYDRDTLMEMLGGGAVGLEQVILEHSSIIRHDRERVATEDARKSLRIVLRVRFPSLQDFPEIDLITKVEKLHALIASAAGSNDPDEIHRAISAAAANLN